VRNVSSHPRHIDWGLRDYQLPPLEWGSVRYAPMSGLAEIEVPGCDPECEHVWGEERAVKASAYLSGYDSPTSTLTTGTTAERRTELAETSRAQTSQGSYCQRCGGWRVSKRNDSLICPSRLA